ncbi:MAG TPA: nucleoside recognition domain-containing protein, partial [Chthoniobacterales bacterium]
MLNYIWLGLLIGAVLLGGFFGKLPDVANAAFESSKKAVMDIALPLAGMMALWLGIMRLAEKSGLVLILAKALRPVLRWLFPEVPANHPAMGSMLMNMAANMLGLSNAATPLGLRAMQDLEKLNPRPGIASNPMCTFLAINTSSIQLIPASAVAILAAAGSKNPSAIIGTAFLATLCSTVAGVTAVKLLERLPGYRLPAPEPENQRKVDEALKLEAAEAIVESQPMAVWARLVLALFAVVMLYFGYQAYVTIAAAGTDKLAI